MVPLLRTAATVLGPLMLLAGCGTAPSPVVATDDPPASSAGTSQPAGASGELVARATVLQAPGERPQLCLGGVAESLPPRCGGPVVTNWDWEGVAHESAAGTSWGDYVVVGTYDGESFTTTRAPVPGEEYDGPPLGGGGEVDLTTPCPEPPGGWAPVDPGRTSDAALDRTVQRASALDGYAGLWLDQSVNPDLATGGEFAANDPARLVLNVAVTGDVAAAEHSMRETWGGALCVSTALRTERELLAIQQELGGHEGVLHSSSGRDVVEVGVVFDDGSLQRLLDERYGPGVVRVLSALRPYRP